MLFNLGNESARESAGIRALSSYQVEGFILNTMGHDAGAIVETARQGKPVVLVDRLHRGLDVDFVSLDNHHAIHLCGRHLRDAGYRELLLVTEPLGVVSSRIERSRAFESFIRAPGSGVSGRCIECPGDKPGDLAAELRRARRRAGRGGLAVISGNAVVTLRVVAAVASLGWVLGRDVGLVGIDETEWAPYVGPGISTISQPTDKLGELATQCLIDRLNGLDIPARTTLLPGKLIVRGSSVRGKP